MSTGRQLVQRPNPDHLGPQNRRTYGHLTSALMGLSDVQLSLLCCISSVSPFLGTFDSVIVRTQYLVQTARGPYCCGHFSGDFRWNLIKMISAASGRNRSPGPTSAGYKGQKILHIFAIIPSLFPSTQTKLFAFKTHPFTSYHKWILSPSCLTSPRPATLSSNPPLMRRRVREDLAMGTVSLRGRSLNRPP